jgi:hypothetical protein
MKKNTIFKNLNNTKSRVILLVILTIILLGSISFVSNYFSIKVSGISDSSADLNSSTWVLDGTEICTIGNTQKNAQICYDGEGGAIIVWEDYRSGVSNGDIYAQKINSTGDIQWISQGVAVCTASNNQVDPKLVSDGAGGAIIAWEDQRDGFNNRDIYAVRINSDGVVQWASNGLSITDLSSEQRELEIVSDGAGGAIITWDDRRSGVGYDIYAQKVNFNGLAQWTGDGVAICNATDWQWKPVICSDESGGAIIAWQDFRVSGHSDMDENDIYAQKINSGGVVQWTANGVQICGAAGNQSAYQICSDEKGGAILTWQDKRNGTYTDIYAQRIYWDQTINWTSDGIVVNNQSYNQEHPQIYPSGLNGAVIIWQDWRDANYDIYGQRISSTGNKEWGSAGDPIINASGDQKYPKICGNESDFDSTFFLTWQDSRGGLYTDIYAQKIDFNAVDQWQSNGVPVSEALKDQTHPEVAWDGSGGSYIVWRDNRGTYSDIYAQRAYYSVPSDPELSILTANPTPGLSIELSWTESVDAIKYFIYRSTSEINSIVGLEPITTLDSTENTYIDTVPDSNTYYYVVVASAIMQNSSISNCENITVDIASTLVPIIPGFEYIPIIISIITLTLVYYRKKTKPKFS